MSRQQEEEYLVEPVGEDEAAALHQLIRVAGHRAYAVLSEAVFEEWLQSMYSVERISERIQDPNILIYRIGDKTAPWATASLTFEEDVAVFGGLYCRHERQGLGSALLKHRLAVARASSAQLARAIPLSENHASISLLQKHGFTLAREENAGERYGADDPWAHLMVSDMELIL